MRISYKDPDFDDVAVCTLTGMDPPGPFTFDPEGERNSFALIIL